MATTTQTLTDLDRHMVDLEREWSTRPAYTERMVRSEFGMTMRQYFARLNTVINSPAAYAYDPLTVRRLRKLRAEQRDRRTLQADWTGA